MMYSSVTFTCVHYPFKVVSFLDPGPYKMICPRLLIRYQWKLAAHLQCNL